MNRGVDSDLAEAISSPAFFPVILVYIDWPDAAVYAHSSVGVIDYDGEDWHGVGDFGSISLPVEAGGLASIDAEFRLVGLPDTLDDYLDDDIRGRAVTVLFGALTERSGNTLVGNPVEVFRGYMDALRDTVQMDDGTVLRSVTLRAAIGPSQRSKAAVFHTPEDQEYHYPGDTAGRLVLFAEANAGKLEW